MMQTGIRPGLGHLLSKIRVFTPKLRHMATRSGKAGSQMTGRERPILQPGSTEITRSSSAQASTLATGGRPSLCANLVLRKLAQLLKDSAHDDHELETTPELSRLSIPGNQCLPSISELVRKSKNRQGSRLATRQDSQSFEASRRRGFEEVGLGLGTGCYKIKGINVERLQLRKMRQYFSIYWQGKIRYKRQKMQRVLS
jgi:hypothetical protein